MRVCIYLSLNISIKTTIFLIQKVSYQHYRLTQVAKKNKYIAQNTTRALDTNKFQSACPFFQGKNKTHVSTYLWICFHLLRQLWRTKCGILLQICYCKNQKSFAISGQRLLSACRFVKYSYIDRWRHNCKPYMYAGANRLNLCRIPSRFSAVFQYFMAISS